jgi:hypothetical protein
MDRGDGASETPRALKVIDTVVGGEERRRVLLREALRVAGASSFPDDPSELLSFVRAYLVPILASEVGPRLATVVLDDIDRATRKEAARRARLHAAMQNGESPPPSSHDGPPSTREQAPTSSVRRRFSVLVVDRDRIGASMLARGMLTGGCDVAVAEAETMLSDLMPDVLIVAERDVIDMPPPLRAFLEQRPDVPVLVRVKEHEHLATSMVQSMGARRCATIASTAPTMETVGVVRKLAAAS